MSGMSLFLVKAELKKRGLPLKGKKASLMARLIVVLKEAEILSHFRVRKIKVWNRLLQFLHKLYKETKGLQHRLVTIYRRGLLIRS